MAIYFGASGSATNSDLQKLIITRNATGGLTAQVVYKVTVLGVEQSHTAIWNLSSAEKSAVVALIPGAKQAIIDELGL